LSACGGGGGRGSGAAAGGRGFNAKDQSPPRGAQCEATSSIEFFWTLYEHNGLNIMTKPIDETGSEKEGVGIWRIGCQLINQFGKGSDVIRN